MRWVWPKGQAPEPLLRRAAALNGVPFEHLKLTIRRRLEYRRCRPKGSRKVGVRSQAGIFRRAGEGELHSLLRAIGMSEREFCAVTGITMPVFLRWYGHPLHQWPLEFLRIYARAQAMGKYLAAEGVDLRQFEPQLPPPHPGPDYPRKRAKNPPPKVELITPREWTPWIK